MTTAVEMVGIYCLKTVPQTDNWSMDSELTGHEMSIYTSVYALSTISSQVQLWNERQIFLPLHTEEMRAH